MKRLGDGWIFVLFGICFWTLLTSHGNLISALQYVRHYLKTRNSFIDPIIVLRGA